MTATSHQERAHSKFSASGSERWLKCPASVALEEASPPSADNHWSKEGTLAHEVLEALLTRRAIPNSFDVSNEMIGHCEAAAAKIRSIQKAFGGTLLVEKRVHAAFIHHEMFGTCDAVIAGFNRTLHIIDFKYGAGHVVSPDENTQLIQYALSVAESYDWARHFDFVKMWILQPRAGANWSKSWMIPMGELKEYWLPLWHKGVARVLEGGRKPFPGGHCHWCRAKVTCPAKQESRVNELKNVFNTPIEGENNGVQKESGKEKARKSFKTQEQENCENFAEVIRQDEAEESFY